MAFEMICGQCRGNLLVEHFGVVVACPHCGAHLHVPDPNAPAAAPPAPTPVPATVSAPEPIPAPNAPPVPDVTAAVTAPAVELPSFEAAVPETVQDPAPSTAELRAFVPEDPEPPPSVEISVVSPVAISDSAATTTEIVTEGPAPATGDGGFSLSSLMSSSDVAASETATAATNSDVLTADATEPSHAQATAEPAAEAARADEPIAAATESAPPGLSGLFGAAASPAPASEAAVIEEAPVVVASASTVEAPPESGLPVEGEGASAATTESEPFVSTPTTSKSSSDHVTVSKSALLLLLSYTSAVTLGFGWLLYQSMTPKEYGIESLPDPVPRKSQKAVLYDERMEMPGGHEVKVGDSQRFGNIKVTVLRVTRGPIQFRHFSDARKSRFPSAPVLKLWLRCENVSQDQEIAPLDDQLLFTRSGKDRFSYRSNQFVCRAEQKTKANALRVIAYDHRIGSEWDLADLLLDKPLKPGESREYYVPTCENDLDKLTGELVWRVHIRKGYSSRGNGVTTLFEVRFKSDDIREEQA